MFRKKRVLLISALLGWGIAIGYLGYQLMAFDSTPGVPASAPARWPKQSSLARVAGRKQLLMFVHPECTCSIASLEQLRNLQKLTGNAIDMRVVLWHRPATTSTRDWHKEVGVAALFVDRDGAESRIFGAKTSGQTLVYDEDGRVMYSGGMTVFRGEAGGEPVLRQIIKAINNANRSTNLQLPVFGCPITDSSGFASSFASTLTTWNRHL